MLKKMFIITPLLVVLAVLLTLWCVDELLGLSRRGDDERNFFSSPPRPLGMASAGNPL